MTYTLALRILFLAASFSMCLTACYRAEEDYEWVQGEDSLSSEGGTVDDSDTSSDSISTDASCAMGCGASRIGDGVCDDDCFIEACAYDGGDCGPPVEECAPGCPDEELGNGECQFDCDVPECDDDGGDCGLYGDEDCPLNSGSPCSCDQDPCNDGTPCMWFGPMELGACTRECDEPGLSTGCESQDWGVPELGGGLCIDDFGAGGVYHCWLSCWMRTAGTEITVHCPAGQTCETNTLEGIGFCSPSY